MKNNSPWLHQLRKERALNKLTQDFKTDVAIVGGGIAGVSTAFFILKNTSLKVTLLEGGRLGHGATGHNAGQIVSYFERPFQELVEEFGLEKSAHAQRCMEGAWQLLDQMYTEAGLNIPLARFNGFDGYSSFDQIVEVLEDNVLKKQGGLTVEPLLIAEHIESKDSIPQKFEGFYKLVPQSEILAKLETNNTGFIALLETQKGVVNSALFTEEVAMYLLEKYADRFTIFENTLIPKVVLKKDRVLLDAQRWVVEAERVILCTNGFEKIKIFDIEGLEIDTRFHHSVEGVVGRMSGYLEDLDKAPTAISYHMGAEEEFENMEDPYFYLTRRTYEYQDNKRNLTCLGGPQKVIPDRGDYEPEYDYSQEFESLTDKFLRKLYNIEDTESVDYLFTWHGLMGYTPTGMRLVGVDPKNKHLLYNLGCNGVGILPSIFGGERISRLIKGEELPPSIFDPSL